MSLDIETLKELNISWCIHYNPIDIIKNEDNKIILNENETANIKFPLNDNYKYFINKIIKGPITVKELLKIIYKFYQEPLEKKYVKQAFKGSKDWYNCVMETVERVEDLKKIDVFTDTCPVTFEGFEYDDETNEYVIELGPL